jgi:hypothetical protein
VAFKCYSAGLATTPGAKLFYVSPFVEMAMRYHFRISPPGGQVKLRILETDREGPLLAATFSGRRRPLTTSLLLRAFAALPLVTLSRSLQPSIAKLCGCGSRAPGWCRARMPQLRTTPIPPWRAAKAALIYDKRYPAAGARSGPVMADGPATHDTREEKRTQSHSG